MYSEFCKLLCDCSLNGRKEQPLLGMCFTSANLNKVQSVNKVLDKLKSPNARKNANRVLRLLHNRYLVTTILLKIVKEVNLLS